jgi:glycerol-3-phosphate dehydrogenase
MALSVTVVYMTQYDVAIIGGGVVGCAIARELMRYRMRATLLERGPEVGAGTSRANSGIIHAGHHSPPDTHKGRLEWLGNQRWDDLAKDLGFGFRRIGELTVAFTEDDLETLHRLQAQGEAKGVPGLEFWGAERVHREEPKLSSEIVAALFAPTAGVVNPYEACFALIESACRNGLALRCDAAVIGLEPGQGGWLIRTASETIQTCFVINATGLEADRIAAMADDHSFHLTARKGEEYVLDKRLQGLVRRLIFPCPSPTSKGILVIPTFDGTLMVGPTAEPSPDREDLSTTLEGADTVFTQVKRLVPGLSERDCIAEFAGVRAVADGEDFIIGPSERFGLVNVAGIQSPGLTAAPAIAEMVLEILGGQGLELVSNREFIGTLEPLAHFAALPEAEQTRLADADPAYRRVVCRCELVTEREVIAAIRRGARTLDGLKFRTRAGMGRCQGGFCTSRCMELLARELPVPFTTITKRGGHSWIVTERRDEQPAHRAVLGPSERGVL